MDSAVPQVSGLRAWPGLDQESLQRAREAVGAGRGLHLPDGLESEMRAVRGRPTRHGVPLVVGREYGGRIARLISSYHRAVETIVRAYPHSEPLRRILRLPDPLHADVAADDAPCNSRLHLCRLDLQLETDGGFKVIETNANCPGGLLSCGIASRRWRRHLGEAGIDLPAPLPHEAPNWMARWFLETAATETGAAARVVALLREEGGNRLELPGLQTQLRDEGVEAIEADPRDLALGSGGALMLRGRVVRHAYLKVGIRELSRMRPAIHTFMTAVRDGRLFVQNGVRGRCIGDNKLCLAVLSDPDFGHLFDPADLDLLRDHLPWSRSATDITGEALRRIRSDRGGYVLKRPLDTKGRGVVIGREVESDGEWSAALAQAAENGWLVQEFCGSAEVAVDSLGAERANHDLSVGAINGSIVGALSRSSEELRMNVARTGRLHPVFLALPRGANAN